MVSGVLARRAKFNCLSASEEACVFRSQAVNSKVLPAPIWLWTSIVPPIKSISFREIASPRPGPAGLPRFETASCVKGSKMNCCLTAGIPIPVGAFDAHWDAIGAGCREHDVVNVIGTSTCIIGIISQAKLVPGVCGVVQGSVDPAKTGIEAGLSATGDIFAAIAQRAGTTVAELSKGLEKYRPGQTGLLRMTWDNGDRTVLVNPNLRGITLGWNLQHSAQDELFAAIEGTAFHTRVILDRMSEYGAPIERVINGGGIPQNNPALNQIYANVLGRPVLVPGSKVTSLGSAIFAFLAAGTFKTIEEAQKKICPSHIVYKPDPAAQDVYRELYDLYCRIYFAFGMPSQQPFGDVLPKLIAIASEQKRDAPQAAMVEA